MIQTPRDHAMPDGIISFEYVTVLVDKNDNGNSQLLVNHALPVGARNA